MKLGRGRRLDFEKLRPHVAMALYADPTHDGRVQREAATLARAGYQVTILALRVHDAVAMPTVDGVKVIAMRPTASQVLPGTRSPFNPEDPGTLRQARGGQLGWATGYAANLRAWGRWALREAGSPALWHAHDFTGLLALALGGLSGRTPLLYDTHELFMELGSAIGMPRPLRRGLREIEGWLARRSVGVITVNDGVAEELSRRYRVDPVVVLNCPPYVEVQRPGRLRAALGLGEQQILLYHGAVSAGRGIEATVEALKYLPPSVVLVVLGDGSLVPWVRAQQQRPELSRRVHWHPAVPLTELLSWVVDADIGVALIAPIQLSFVLATPNKLFECMTAGVPVIVSDFPEMRRIVLGERIGEVCDPTNPPLIAETVRGMLSAPAELATMRERARDAARTTYNWDAQAAKLLDLYHKVMPLGALPRLNVDSLRAEIPPEHAEVPR